MLTVGEIKEGMLLVDKTGEELPVVLKSGKLCVILRSIYLIEVTPENIYMAGWKVKKEHGVPFSSPSDKEAAKVYLESYEERQASYHREDGRGWYNGPTIMTIFKKKIDGRFKDSLLGLTIDELLRDHDDHTRHDDNALELNYLCRKVLGMERY